jgi:hypothetical protein
VAAVTVLDEDAPQDARLCVEDGVVAHPGHDGLGPGEVRVDRVGWVTAVLRSGATGKFHWAGARKMFPVDATGVRGVGQNLLKPGLEST